MDVVKIESRPRPEALRNTYFLDHPDVFEPSGVPTTALYGGLARSVRSVAVELAAPAAPRCSAGWRPRPTSWWRTSGPDVLDRFGCGFDDLHALNPRLTMLSISGYGRTGPRVDVRGVRLEHQQPRRARASAWGHTHGYHFDYVAGYHGALGVLAALRQTADHRRRRPPRPRPGRGRRQRDDADPRRPAGHRSALRASGQRRRPARSSAPWSRCAGADRWLAVDAVDRADWDRLCARGRRCAPDRRALAEATSRPARTALAGVGGHPHAVPGRARAAARRRRRRAGAGRRRPRPATRSCGRAASSSRSTTPTSAASSTRARSSAPFARRGGVKGAGAPARRAHPRGARRVGRHRASRGGRAVRIGSDLGHGLTCSRAGDSDLRHCQTLYFTILY